MKTVEEWSAEFDMLYNNITSNQAPGLTEYEKSKFLTDAQEAVVVMLYNGTARNSFEETEEITDYLSTLVKQADINGNAEDKTMPHIVEGTKIYRLPNDILFRTLELCTLSDVENCDGTVVANVVPVTQDEFWRTHRNPFKKQNERRVLRLAQGKYGSDPVNGEGKSDYSELYSDYPIAKYTVRYIKRPEPIILCYLDDGLGIRGKTAPCTCKLDEALHLTILAEAVRMAKAVWNS